jgi:hypothetical protein
VIPLSTIATNGAMVAPEKIPIELSVKTKEANPTILLNYINFNKNAKVC